jgi:hypothetical protein
MAGRKMLRELMNVADIYAQAESISQMLREDYGGYDADVFDEVLVDESFAQRLAARGYEVRPWNATTGAVAASRPVSGDVVPVQIVRRGASAAARATAPSVARTATPSTSRTTPVAAPAAPASEPPASEPPAEEAPAQPASTSRTRATSTRSTTRASSGTTGTRSTSTTRTRRAITSDAAQLADEPTTTATRTRRTRTTRAADSDEA